jgi:transposase
MSTAARRPRKELTPAKRSELIEAYCTGATLKAVASIFDVPYSTVRDTIHREGKATPSQRGKTRRTTAAIDKLIETEALAKPQRTIRELLNATAATISRSTVNRRLREKKIIKRVMVQRPFFTSQVMKQRLEWAEFHRNWILEDWQNVIWSDECSVERGSGKQRKWIFYRPSDKWRQDLIDGRKKGKNHRVIIWAALSGHTQSSVVILAHDPEAARGGCTSRGYLKLIQEHLPPLLINDNAVFMQDNAPIHTAKVVKDWFWQSGIDVMPWPPYLPDLNPIEHAWPELNEEVYEAFPDIEALMGGQAHIEAELGKACLESWARIRDAHFVKLVASMEKRRDAVLKAKGEYTRY